MSLAAEITANITCDNRCSAHADRNFLGDDNAYWYTVTKFTFPKGTKIIGIHAKDNGGSLFCLATMLSCRVSHWLTLISPFSTKVSNVIITSEIEIM